jgi:hypothetical protein
MAFTLVGVQVAQASPLHHHIQLQHTVDCALCHLQLSDDVLVHYRYLPTVAPGAAPNPLAPTRFYSFSSPSPYQGRAPPRLYS